MLHSNHFFNDFKGIFMGKLKNFKIITFTIALKISIDIFFKKVAF